MANVKRGRAFALCVGGVLLTPFAFARWEYKGANDILGAYTDATSVHEVQGRRRIKMLHDFKAPQRNPAGFQYQSTLFFIEFECSKNSFAVYSTVQFSGHMASGNIVHTHGGSPLLAGVVRPDSAESAARNVACATSPGRGPVGSEILFWSGNGNKGAQAAPSSGRQQAPQKQSDLDFFRDLGMGKPNTVNVVPSKNRNSPFSNSDIADACENLIRDMEIGYRGGMDVYQVDILPPVKPSQSGLPTMLIPQTDVMYPAKVYVHFQNGGGRRYTQVYLYKSPFGTKCMRAS